jgi:hypothetical protein
MLSEEVGYKGGKGGINNVFVWLLADDWCLFVLREKYCWLVADKPSEQGANLLSPVGRPASGRSPTEFKLSFFLSPRSRAPFFFNNGRVVPTGKEGSHSRARVPCAWRSKQTEHKKSTETKK